MALDPDGHRFLVQDADGDFQQTSSRQIVESVTTENATFVGFVCVAVAQYRRTTAFNVNRDVDFAWDTTQREDDGITLSANGELVTVAGQPDHIDISVNIPIAIDNASSVQRPNQYMSIVRSDGDVIGATATGYIRDQTDHEQSSHNVTDTDAAPISDASYGVIFVREGSNSGVVNSDPLSTRMTVKVYKKAYSLSPPAQALGVS